jgi:hypothetical protein
LSRDHSQAYYVHRDGPKELNHLAIKSANAKHKADLHGKLPKSEWQASFAQDAADKTQLESAKSKKDPSRG